jgi:L-fuconolactonase
MNQSTVDSHHHFWRHSEPGRSWPGAEHEALARDFLPADMRARMAAAGVHRSVLVQSANNADDNARMLRHAADAPWVAGIVAWLPLDDPATADRMLPDLLSEPRIRGVRTLIARDDVGWLLRPPTLRLLADLAAAGRCWDVVPVTPHHVRTVLAVAEQVPALRIVIDHLGRPPVETGGWSPWAEHIRDLAGCPGMAVKVSVGIDVLTVWPRWSADALHRYVDLVLEQFRPHRMMLASNWPVIEVLRSYEGAWRDLDERVRACGATGEDMAQVRGGTAATWYGLEHS